MTVYEATGYFISKLLEKNDPMDLKFSVETRKGTHFVTEQEKESIFITIPKKGVEICLHNMGINLKVSKSSALAGNFPNITTTGVAKKFFNYSKDISVTEKIDEAVDFIKSLS